ARVEAAAAHLAANGARRGPPGAEQRPHRITAMSLEPGPVELGARRAGQRRQRGEDQPPAHVSVAAAGGRAARAAAPASAPSSPRVARSCGSSGGTGQGSQEVVCQAYSVTTARRPIFSIVASNSSA